jgi:hypothetical protein
MNKGKWTTGGDDDWLGHLKEDIENMTRQIREFGPDLPPFTIGHEAWKQLQKQRDYLDEYQRRPGDSLITRFKKWRKHRQMKRLFKHVKIVDRRIVNTFNNQPFNNQPSSENTEPTNG